MATLTWRDVATPNFSPAMEGVRTAAGLFDSAFAGLDRTFQRFEGAKDQRANKAFQMELLRFQDPEAYRAALEANPTLGFDPDRLDLSSIQAAGARTGQLLNEANSDLQLEAGKFRLGEDKGAAERQKALGEILPKAYAMGNEEEGAAYLASEMAGKGFRADEIDKTLGNLFGLAKDRSGLANDRQSRSHADTRLGWDADRHAQDKWRFGNEQVTYEEQRAAQSVLADITAMSGGDPDYAFQLLQKSGLRGNAYNLVLSGLPGGGSSGGSGSGLSGGSGDASGLRIMNYEAQGKGFNSVPANVKTLGQASDFAITVNRAGASSSAMGLYQITGETMRDFAPKLFGKNWRTKYFDFAAQDRMGKAIFDSTGGKPDRLRSRWTSLKKLSNNEVAALGRMPWEQARETIARLESGSSPSAILAQSGGVAPPTASENAVANAGSKVVERQEAAKLGDWYTQVYDKGIGVNFNKRQAINAARQSSWGEDLKDINDGALRGYIDWVKGYAKKKGVPMTDGQAMSLLGADNVIRNRRASWDGYFAPVTGGYVFDTNKMINRDAVDTHLAKIKPEKAVDRAVGREAIRQGGKTREAAQADANRTQAQYESALARGFAVRNPAKLAELKEARDQAAAVARALNNR